MTECVRLVYAACACLSAWTHVGRRMRPRVLSHSSPCRSRWASAECNMRHRMSLQVRFLYRVVPEKAAGERAGQESVDNNEDQISRTTGAALAAVARFVLGDHPTREGPELAGAGRPGEPGFVLAGRPATFSSTGASA
jgi:hypothetical protein